MQIFQRGEWKPFSQPSLNVIPIKLLSLVYVVQLTGWMCLPLCSYHCLTVYVRFDVDWNLSASWAFVVCCCCAARTKLTDGTELFKWQSLIGCWQAEDSTYPGCELEQAMINTRWPPKTEQIFQCHWTVLYLLVVSYNLSTASRLHCCIMQGDQQTMEQVVESLASLCRKV